MKQRPLFDRNAEHYVRRINIAGNTALFLDSNCLLRCPVCHQLTQLQMRIMGDGTVRNQPRCSSCRKVKTKGK